MYNNGFKIFTIIAILLFIYGCIKTTTYIAPHEADKIYAARKIIVTLSDGTEWELKNPYIENNKIIGIGYDNRRKEIDLSLITSVRTEKTDYTYAVLYGLAAAITVGLLIGAATAPEPPPPESCPFVYSFDGEKYILDAEPYGAAICQGLKRTEWCGLEQLKETNGYYKIMIANELDETQYTDELRLVVVDHPNGIEVVPDTSGGIHTVSQPHIPLLAYDSEGNDLVPIISKNDLKFWRTRLEGKNPDKKEDLRDELIFEFPKPRGAKKAKLIVNAYTTFWGSQMVKRLLDLHGKEVYEWYKEVDNFGPAYFKVTSMNIREELYCLKIRVETEIGWKSKGFIFGGGPFISDDKVYVIDISDVPGETLKIKLTPPANFWMINYLALDYTEDINVRITEIEPAEAMDRKGRDVRGILTQRDNTYFVMPNIGDEAELVFESPPQDNSMDRSIILKVSGYYDIHLDAKAEPQREILNRYLMEPDFAIHYAFKEYLKWKKENTKRTERK